METRLLQFTNGMKNNYLTWIYSFLNSVWECVPGSSASRVEALQAYGVPNRAWEPGSEAGL